MYAKPKAMDEKMHFTDVMPCLKCCFGGGKKTQKEKEKIKAKRVVVHKRPAQRESNHFLLFRLLIMVMMASIPYLLISADKEVLVRSSFVHSFAAASSALTAGEGPELEEGKKRRTKSFTALLLLLWAKEEVD